MRDVFGGAGGAIDAAIHATILATIQATSYGPRGLHSHVTRAAREPDD